MVNSQGQLTPTERALNRAAPGFAMMLQSVQQFANRVEENTRLAEQRNFQREMVTTQFDNQVKLAEKQSELSVAAQRELMPDNLEFQKEIIKLQGNQQMALQTMRATGEAAQLRQRAGMDQQKMLMDLISDRQNTLTKMAEDYGLTNIALGFDEASNSPFYYQIEEVDGRMVQRVISDVEFNHMIAERAAVTRSVAEFRDAITSMNLTPETQAEGLGLAAKAQSGEISLDQFVSEQSVLMRRVNQEIIGLPERQQMNLERQRTVGTLTTQLFPNQVTGSIADVRKDLGVTRAGTSILEMSIDRQLIELLGRVNNGNLNETQRDRVRNEIRSHLQRNYLDLRTAFDAAQEKNYGDLIQNDPNRPRNPERHQFVNNLNFTLSNIPADQIVYASPFNNDVVNIDSFVKELESNYDKLIRNVTNRPVTITDRTFAQSR